MTLWALKMKNIDIFLVKPFLCSLPVAEWFCAQNWYTGGTGLNSRSRLPFGYFHGFLPNSHIYRLGSPRKTPHGGHSIYSFRSLLWQLDLKPTTNESTNRFFAENKIAFLSSTRLISSNFACRKTNIKAIKVRIALRIGAKLEASCHRYFRTELWAYLMINNL